MKIVHGILILLVLGLLVPGSAALKSEEIEITSSHAWITAGPGTGIDETATITVKINNDSVTNGTITINEVLFSCPNEFLSVGALSPARDTLSPYQATFHTKKSGNATITVTVKYTLLEGESESQHTMSNAFVQKVDHATPYAFAYLDYDTELTVNTDTTIEIRMVDKYRNVIDSRKEDSVGGDAEWVRFQCSSGTDAGFWDEDGSLTDDIQKQVDSDGYLAVDFKAASLAGENVINLICVTAIPRMWITIDGVGEETPYSVETAIDPSPPRLPGDGTSFFTIIYTFYDRFGNPSPNTTVDFSTSLGENREIITNGYGETTIRYGPKTSIGTVKLTTTSVLNTSVVSILNLIFTSSDGTSFDVSVNPSSMPSAEVTPFTPGQIRVLVTDDLGRGVPNQTVSFRINTATITNSTTLLSPPKIAATKLTDPDDGAWADVVTGVETDENGIALVYFKPGEFPIEGEDGYLAFARGSCTVTADWKSYSKETSSIEWRNYPYLRVEAEVSNPTVGPGETFDVTLRLIGDGFELIKRDPIDVVLATSRAYTMLKEDPTDRLRYAMEAEQAFVNVLKGTSPDGGVDNIGLLTFGGKSFGNARILGMDKQWKKLAGDDNSESDDATYVESYYLGEGLTDYTTHSYWEQPFTSSTTDIETAIYLTIPYQDKSKEKNVCVMPLRLAVYDAISALRGTSNTIKAVILLVDSDITWYGDVLAEGSYDYAYDDMNGGTNRYYPFAGPTDHPGYPWNPDKSVQPLQNMANYAKDENVKIYVVYAASKVNNADWTTLNTLATETGGAFNYTSGDAAKLEEIYKWIADQLINEAAVGTTADLQLVGFNDPQDALDWSATTLLDYVYADGESTYIQFFDWSSSPYVADTYLDGTPLTIDTSDDWYGITPPEENDPAGSFHFDVGNISVKQTWEVTFRMLVNASANDTINFSVFHPNSGIYFENAEDPYMPLPDTLITIIPGLAPDPVYVATFQLNELSGAFTGEFYEFEWALNYTGWGDIKEEIEYRPANSGWIRVETRPHVVNTTLTDNARVNLKDHPFGTYYFRVVAHTEDAGFRTGTWEYDYDPSGISYIRIQ